MGSECGAIAYMSQDVVGNISTCGATSNLLIGSRNLCGASPAVRDVGPIDTKGMQGV